MSAINGFCTFSGNVSSLYWQRICRLMTQHCVKRVARDGLYWENQIQLCACEAENLFTDGEMCCVFAGNITNYKTLKSRLDDMGEKQGESFAETFLNIYKVMGVRGAAIVFGEFSAAIWDGQKKKLVVFRDKSGTLPLYYAYVNERFVFSSAIDAILRFPGVYPVVTERGLADLFCCAGMINPYNTPFESIKRIPPGCAVEVSGKGVRVKNYYSLNPSDKFNAAFLAKDAIRIRGGEMLCCRREPTGAETVFSTLDNVRYTGFPVYSDVAVLTCLLSQQKSKDIYIPFLPPEQKTADFSFLLKAGCLTGVDKEHWQNDSLVNYATKMNIYFDDEMKMKMWSRLRLTIHTHYGLWNEVLTRYSSMTDKNVIIPLSDARFLECVTDGGGKDYIYKGNIFLPDADYVKKILLNELGEGKRPVFSFMDEAKTREFIKSTEDVKALLYILAIDYWTLRYHVETDLIADI